MAAWDKDLDPSPAPAKASARPAWERDLDPTPAKAEQPSFGQMLKAEVMTGPVGGLVRGVKDVIDTGAELLATGYDKVTGADAPTLSSLVTGQPQGEAARVKAMNEAGKADFKAAQDLAGAGTSDAFRVGGQILATAPVGGVLAAPVKAAARSIPALTPFANALASSGMSTGRVVQPGVVNALKDLAIRVPAGAAVGGAAAGLVDPEQAGLGAVVGGALPVALKGAGALGSAVGRTIRGPEQAADLTAAVERARKAGLVVPPTQARPTLTNRLLEGFAGKLTTAQNASAKNAEGINRLARAELGLADDAPLNMETLDKVREEAGKAYRALAALPERPAVSGSSLMNTKAVEGFSPKQALQELRQARNDATAWYAAYGRSASPDDQAKAKAAAAIASKIEKQFEEHAKALGRDDLLPAMQEARKLIAKTYTIEKALNPTTGSVDARKLGSMVTKGKPLSGGLKEAGDFANRFPKAAQAVEGMGSLPQTSPLDWSLGVGMSAVTMNPLAMAGVMARPAARSLALSPIVQNRLAQQAAQPNALANLLANSQLEQLGYQAAPVFAATGR